MKIFSGCSNVPLAEKVANELGLRLSPIEFHIFPDGERRVKLNDTVIDEDTVIIQSTAAPVDQNYMELFFIIDALKRSGARSITAVIPYLGYQRQDHVFRDGESVSLQVMIRIMESLEVDNIISIDLHSIKIPELFHIQVKQLSALPLFAEQIKKLSQQKECSLVSPDLGGLRRIRMISELLDNMPWVATVKDRDLQSGDISIKSFEGDMALLKKRVCIVDDMISSGKTIVQSVQLLQKNGVEEFYVFATHPVFSKDATTLLQDSVISKVFVTDTVRIPVEHRFPKLEVLSVADTIAAELQEK